jgi:hypothetical protein
MRWLRGGESLRDLPLPFPFSRYKSIIWSAFRRNGKNRFLLGKAFLTGYERPFQNLYSGGG